MGIASAEDICNMALLYAGINKRLGSLTTDTTSEAQACNTIYDQMRQNLYTEFRWSFTIERAALTVLSGSTYDATHTYALNDYAQFGDNVYQSLQAANLNHEPDLAASAAWWKQITRDGWAYVCPAPVDMLDPINLWESPSTNVNDVPPTDSDDDDDQVALVIRAPTSAEREPFAVENANDGTDSEVILTDLDAPVLRYVKDVSNPAEMHPKFIETFAWHLAMRLAFGLRNDTAKGEFCEKMAMKTLGEAFVVNMRGVQEDPEPASEFELARRGAV